MKNIIKLLQANKNLILTGAPGTGKTYKTAEIAVALIDGTDKLPSTRIDLMKRYKELIDAKQIAFTTFHQSMDYEEFIEGLKPIVDEDNHGEMTYQVKDGIFKEICGYAYKNYENFNKPKEQLSKETWSEEKFNKFLIDEIIDGCTMKKTTDGSEFKVFGVNEEKKSIYYKQTGVKGSNRNALYSDIINAYIDGTTENDAILKNKRLSRTARNEGLVTYYSSLVKAFSEYLDKNNYHFDPTVENKNQNIELKKYILIIDEINRGNISKIFGELITLLEKDKRLGEENEITATLPYSQEKFGVPSNLFIIGTMNTADRSIGHIDYAIRRRFSFLSLKSDENVISSYDKYDNGIKEKAISLFNEIKIFISANINADLDADDLMIGHSYFLCKSADDLKMRLEFEIIPLIEEYEKDGIIMLDKSSMKTEFEKWKALLS